MHDAPVFQPQLVKIEGRTVEMVSAGRRGPLVVLESGLGDGWSSWKPILTMLSERCRLFAYSRPGYDSSSDVATPRDISTEAKELRSLLHALGEQPPYVLVGHSLGGLIVQSFAAMHPEEVSGLLAVDAPHPDQIEYLNRDTTDAGSEYRKFADALRGAPRREHESLVAPRGGHFQGELSLYDGPTLFLCAWLRPNTVSLTYQRLRRVLALAVAAGYPRAELRKICCGHYIHHDRPLAVIDAVDEILARMRSSRPDEFSTNPTWQVEL